MKGIEHRVRYAVFPGDSPTTGEIKPLGPIDRTLTTSPSSLIKIFDQARRLSEEARELLEDQQMHLGLSPQPKSPHPSESQQGPDSPESRQSSNLQCVADLDSPQFRSHGCAPSRQDESINPDNVPRSPTHNVFRLTERHGRNASRLMRGCGGDGDDDSDSDPGKNRELPVSNPTPRQSSSSSSSNNGEQDEGNDSPAEAEPRTDKGNVRAAEASLGMDMASAVPTSEVIQKKLEHGARKDRRLQAEIDIISGRGENDVEHKLFQADLNKARNEKLASPSNSFIRRRDAAIQAILVRRTHIVSNDTLQSPDGLEDRLQAQVFHPRAAGGPQPAEDLPLQDVERPAKSDISALVGQAGPSEGQRSIDAIVASFVAEAPKENGSRAGKGKIS
ncbi:MAG: hypothetical protein M1832_005198 [Thelocarpon impressellum]|nr:MAG: hypothetical protein M1832_005198 [Thelocarpon impressellum]